MSLKSFFDPFFWKVYTNLLSLTFIPNWLIKKSDQTILDVGCGQGLPMELINLRHSNLISTGIDLFKPYIDQCKIKKTHNKYLICDVRKLPFKRKSFDVVMALQIIEHLKKGEARIVLKKLETIAKNLIIISTPIGISTYHTEENPLQEHQSFFYPEEFKKLGYRIIRIGGKSLFQEESGLVSNTKSSLLRKMLIVLDIFLTPYYLLFPSRADYYFYAYKHLN